MNIHEEENNPGLCKKQSDSFFSFFFFGLAYLKISLDILIKYDEFQMTFEIEITCVQYDLLPDLYIK